MSEPSSEGAGRFPTTDWSLVGHAGDKDDSHQRIALGELLQRYWPALKAHLVIAKRIHPHDAEDLVQGFIETKVLRRNLVGIAEQTRGKFRGLLVTALDNYAANQLRQRTARKRSADCAMAVDPREQDRRSSSQVAVETVFDIEWARQLLAEVARRMQAECVASGRPDLWGVFEARILGPIVAGAEPIGYQNIVRRFHFRSPSQASNALITAKRMYARLLRAVVAEYVLEEEDIDREISGKYCNRFGVIAVDKGFVTAYLLKEALAEQADDNIFHRPHRLIGRIFFDKGWMTDEQINISFE